MVVGQTVGHYRILGKLGAGGMGEVYLAEDTTLKRQVALKVLPPDLAASRERLDRFQREAETLAALDHPNIVTIYSVEEANGVHFLTMQLVEGERLSDLIPRGGMRLARIFEIAIPLADALAAAHEKGVIHRDLKPGNIMVTKDGRVKVLDFGLAKLRQETAPEMATQLPTEPLTEEGRILGTVPYMSPEQLEGGQLDGRTDIFSLGVVLYELATGERPFQGDSSVSLISSIMRDTPREVDTLRAEVPHHLARIIRHCLEKEPARRYQSALDVRNELEDLRREEVSHETVATPPVVGLEVSANKWWWAAAGAVLVLLGVTFGYLMLRTGPPQEAIMAPEAAPPRIVVLPFENLGAADDSYFASGITEEITSRLAAVSGLQVISRTSARRYADTDKSIGQIGEELRVGYILEGTIRWDRAGAGQGRVRITPQLIRVADDSHLWSERYDRVLEDIFTVQSDIAEEVITRLEATLLEPERRAVEARPTDNMDAYQAYLLGFQYMWGSDEEKSQRLAVEMLERAVGLDPEFAVAHAVLSEAHGLLYHFRSDFTTERLEQAKSSAERALALQPGLPEGHRALGYYYYFGFRDYDRAREQFAIAAESLPNDADLLSGIFVVSRRQGLWDEALLALENWLNVDPQDYVAANEASITYMLLRDFAKAEEEMWRAISIAPEVPDAYFVGVLNYVLWDGATDRARRLWKGAPDLDSPHIEYLSLLLDLYDRKPESALARVQDVSIQSLTGQVRYESKELLECIILSEMGEGQRAKAPCASALEILEREIEARPRDHRLYIALGHAYSVLRRSEEAVRAGEQAVELIPISRDAGEGAAQAIELAKIYTRVGRHDKALSLIEELLSIPCNLSVGLLRLDPVWDPLRDHPGFQALLEKHGQRTD